LYARQLEELAVLADLFLQIGDLLLDPIASVPAMKRRGGGTFPATVRSGCASFAGPLNASRSALSRMRTAQSVARRNP
jgi:hypothetical protein